MATEHNPVRTRPTPGFGLRPPCYAAKTPMSVRQNVNRRVSSRALDSFQFIACDTPDFVVEWFADWLTTYINDGATIKDEQTLQCGFVILKCRVKNRLLSLLSPDFDEMPIRWTDDLRKSLGIITAHKYTPESVGLIPDIPSLQQTAITGERFAEFPMFANRSTPSSANPNDSGWFVGSQDADNNDPATLQVMSLYELVLKVPHVLQFLSLPVGCQVVFSAGTPVLLKDYKEVAVPPDSYLGQVLGRRGIA